MEGKGSYDECSESLPASYHFSVAEADMQVNDNGAAPASVTVSGQAKD